MRSQTKRKIVTLSMIAALMVGNMTVANAAELKNSVGSDSSNTSVGVDTTQGKSTEYENATINSTTYTKDNAVSVYATKTSWVTVSVPKTLILGPDASNSSKYSCSFDVSVEGDIAGAQSVTITPSESSSLVEVDGKKTSPECAITLNGKNAITYSANDLVAGKKTATGKITTDGMKAGTYKTNMIFNVAINYGK